MVVAQTGNGVIGQNVDQTADSRGGSVAGARSDQTNVTLDGLDNNDQLTGLAFQGALRAPLDSIQEFRVTTSNSNADAGRSSGAQVSLVTKSGTNSFHGSLYEYNRSNIGQPTIGLMSRLNTARPAQQARPLLQYLWRLGWRPDQKDRLSFWRL
jgi:hypothetical protein